MHLLDTGKIVFVLHAVYTISHMYQAYIYVYKHEYNRLIYLFSFQKYIDVQ